MGQIEGTPQYKLAKITIANRLEEELLTHYNNITSQYDSIMNLKNELRRLTETYEPDLEFDSKMNDLMNNIESYLPQFESNIQGENTYLDEMKNILIETYDKLPVDSELLTSLNISSFDDILSMEEIPTNLIENLTTNSIGISVTNILTDFQSGDIGLGSVLAVAEHNLGLTNISGSLDSIVSLSDTLVTNFGDVANLESIQGMLNTLPDTLANMSLDTLGNLDVAGVLSEVGVPMDAIQNVLNAKDLMNNIVGNITGQISNLVQGFGGCACSIPIGGGLSGLVDTVAKVQELGQQVMGQINSTMNSIMNDLPISNFPDVAGLQDALTNQLSEYKDVIGTAEGVWSAINKT